MFMMIRMHALVITCLLPLPGSNEGHWGGSFLSNEALHLHHAYATCTGDNLFITTTRLKWRTRRLCGKFKCCKRFTTWCLEIQIGPSTDQVLPFRLYPMWKSWSFCHFLFNPVIKVLVNWITECGSLTMRINPKFHKVHGKLGRFCSLQCEMFALSSLSNLEIMKCSPLLFCPTRKSWRFF